MWGKALTGLFLLLNISWSCARQTGCDERGPICGNDGKTYETMCTLIWARLDDTDLQVLHEGSCTVTAGSVLSSHKEELDTQTKIKSVMPYGWPPLGPIVQRLRNMLRSADENKSTAYSPQKT
ncbi:unnamed protein product [Chrysodeixis includens]|uniref:Kazal-like domain-containing protein n=1 Tax=Chrysodeixis includens TaxID=689277 RepID=A0A9N8PZY3_CHRIL|nr:unnamed protein product [Chrysodeixis includens]